MATEDAFTVDDLVTEAVASWLGDGVLPTNAVLVVETMSERGTGLRYVISAGLQTWHAMGMIRSIEINLEGHDLDQWGDGE